jgi:outer membrane protein assembly factor BamD (BamD/ComL family)
MIRLATALGASALLASLGNAPMQCGHGSGSGSAREDEPGDALYALSQDFHAKGNDEAAKQTLRFLLEKYPSNRHAPAARAELEGATESRTDAGK